MHIYILGICGTFMGSLAILAREIGHEVSGCDDNVYPPMSTQLANAGIHLDTGYKTEFLANAPDIVVIGNAMSRGNPMVEHVLNTGIAYTSGPQFLHDYVIKDKWVLAVAGTHGKTTTASMLAWILEYADMKPGFLIGGVLNNFPFSARMGDSAFFVVEADEYDTAFFDKRSKFLHYQPRTLVMNNLEYDHADIFDNIDAIKRQFHHVMRIVPNNGRVVFNHDDKNLHDVIAMGCWTPTMSFGESGDWQAKLLTEDGGAFELISNHQPAEKTALTIQWQLTGKHNVNNALAAVAAAEHVGVHPAIAVEALSQFDGVKRRMEKYAEVASITLYDDFAHHPTAIATTLEGIRAKVKSRVLAVLEPRSNTMKMGVHATTLAASVDKADKAFWFMSEPQGWKMQETAGEVYTDLPSLIKAVVDEAKPGDHIVLMSNGGFQGLHQKLKTALEALHAK
jgi:UDP-N-acetylmuramate: L-alanyl-gamma-D-glutamyl-meso-diaminopimelate ligase